MEIELSLKLQNVYGGDGFTRPHEIEETKLARTKKKVVTRKDIGIPVESSRTELKTEKRKVLVNTFKHDEKGNYYLRLGASHGKLWGAMKEAGFSMAELGKVQSQSAVRRMMRMVSISPQWVLLEDVNGVELDKLSQVLNAPGNPMVQNYFDVIPECRAKVTMKFPDELKEQIMQFLKYVETMNCLNKRRGSITVAEKKILS